MIRKRGIRRIRTEREAIGRGNRRERAASSLAVMESKARVM